MAFVCHFSICAALHSPECFKNWAIFKAHASPCASDRLSVYISFCHCPYILLFVSMLISIACHCLYHIFQHILFLCPISTTVLVSVSSVIVHIISFSILSEMDFGKGLKSSYPLPFQLARVLIAQGNPDGVARGMAVVGGVHR